VGKKRRPGSGPHHSTFLACDGPTPAHCRVASRVHANPYAKEGTGNENRWETIREMNKVAIGRVVLTNREHIVALEPLEKGLVGTLLRYPYEVQSEEEYFDEI
jgi:hypothetical protein